MARTTKKSIMVGGEEFILSLDMNILCDIEEHFGRSVESVFTDKERLGIKVVRDLIYLTARRLHRDITPEHIGSLMETNEMPDYFDTLSDLITTFGGEPKNDQQAEG